MSAARNTQGLPMQLTYYVSPAVAEEIRAYIVSQMHLFVDKGLLNVPPGTRFLVDANFRPLIEVPIKDEFADMMPDQQHQAINFPGLRASPSPEPVLISKRDFELLLHLLNTLPDSSHYAFKKVRDELVCVFDSGPSPRWAIKEIWDQVNMALGQFNDDIGSIEHYARMLDGMKDTDLEHDTFPTWFPQVAARLCGRSAADEKASDDGPGERDPAGDFMAMFYYAADPHSADSDIYFYAFKISLRGWALKRRQECPPPGLANHMLLLRRKGEL